jgi:hypothetical protein
MENELEFLIERENSCILEAEITDVISSNGKDIGISLTIGASYEEMNDPNEKYVQYEIVLTKKELNKILKIMKNY